MLEYISSLMLKKMWGLEDVMLVSFVFAVLFVVGLILLPFTGIGFPLKGWIGLGLSIALLVSCGAYIVAYMRRKDAF